MWYVILCFIFAIKQLDSADTRGFLIDGSLFRVVPIAASRNIFHYRLVAERDILFKLYTSENPKSHDILKVDNDDLLQSSHFDWNRPTVLYFHGFVEPGEISRSGTHIKDAYLQRGGHNFILVDYSVLAAAPWYGLSIKNAKVVGMYSAKFIDYLVSRGLSLPSLHVIGHSLGGQVAGLTAQEVRSGRVERVTGLDPALPGFRSVGKDSRLDASDAKFVDVIHTDSGLIGYDDPIGHVDFYPNGGRNPQPDCSVADLVHEPGIFVKVFCSHWTSFEYYADTVNDEHRYPAVPCSSWKNFVRGQCPASPSNVVYMGYAVPNTARGIYYLHTGRRKPVRRLLNL